jgi:hypothetical protein
MQHTQGKTKMHKKYFLKSIRGRDTLKDIPVGDKVIGKQTQKK